VKWIDLCLRSSDSNHWCWFEFKVRHKGLKERANKAALEARDAFHKDVVALLGFKGPIELTCHTEEEIESEIRLTVLHEVGHFFGLEEEQLE
jgi:predicted Zn-dependent protease with MMP-like domain